MRAHGSTDYSSRGARLEQRARNLGLAFVVAAPGARWWSISSLGSAWNVQAQVPRDLSPVTAGPYRYLRHPNYLALIVEFVALPMAVGAWRSAIGLSLLNGLATFDRVRAEEARLNLTAASSAALTGKARLSPVGF